jgi:hypothetical protein
VAVLAVCFVLAAGVALGQKESPLPADHPEIYYSFFFFMENFSQWLDARAQEAPARKVKLMESAARYLKVDVSEIPKIAAECQAATARHSANRQRGSQVVGG